MSDLYKYELEIEDYDYIDEERRGYGAYIYATILYRLEDVIEADTPFGPVIRQEIVVHEIEDCNIFVMDQDGGELYDEPCDLENYMSQDDIIVEIQKNI